MSDLWWRRKKRFRFDFDEFDRVEEIMDDLMRQSFEITPRKTKCSRRYIPGVSMPVGPNGKPVIREFCGVRLGKSGYEILKERKPLVDVIEEDVDVVVVAELPGVERDDINIVATESSLAVSVETPKIKYHKELVLPVRVNLKSARASHKNGVLEVRLKKLVQGTARDDEIPVG